MGFVLISVVCVPCGFVPAVLRSVFPNQMGELAVYQCLLLFTCVMHLACIMTPSLGRSGKLVMKISMVSQWVVSYVSLCID